MSLLSWLGQESRKELQWQRGTQNYRFSVILRKSEHDCEGVVFNEFSQVTFHWAKKVTPEETARELEESLLLTFPELVGTLYPAKTALERVLGEEML